jgi:myo-inositol 2-dehydrogenase/D-chiro-inositol 1-dehydrogenase
MLKVAVIGAGRMGQIRALTAKALGAEVRFVCDTNRQRANALARQVGAGALVDEQEVRFDELDALFLCTPPLFRDIGVKAVEQGVHLLVEKPLGLSTEACLPLLQALDHRPVITAVGFMNRYRDGVAQVKTALQKEIPLGFTAHWFGGRYQVPWWSDPLQSGGPINEQCAHLVDLGRYLMGEITSVTAITDGKADLSESLALSLQFGGGQLGTLLYSCKATEKSIGLQVVTAHRTMRLAGWDFQPAEKIPPESDKNLIFRVEIANFFRAIQKGDRTAVLSDVHDAWRTQKILASIMVSASTQAAVAIA